MMLRALCPLAALVLLVAMPRSAQAETIVGLVEGNDLVTFDTRVRATYSRRCPLPD